MPRNDEDIDIPSIYVNQSILEHAPLPDINVLRHVDDQPCEEAENSFAEFQVFRMEGDGDMYCSTPPTSESDTADYQNSELRVTLQPAPNGFIINGTCFLSWQQWNTLVTPAVSLKLFHCVVCSQYCEADAGNDHVTTLNHRLALQAFPPLEKFDLSITRKIRNQYHCAVCNEIFDLSSEFDHFGGKMHEGNLLFSQNKASDILDNSFEHNNNSDKLDTYHFKTHAMNDAESVGSEPCDNLNYVNFQNNYYFDDYEEEQPAFTGLSYATMAKKPKANTQTFIEVDLGNKKVTVRFDSWHMVIRPQLNRFWCMVCKKLDHLRNKQEHCATAQHLTNLRQCTLVQEYDEYFIRQVDDKLYHCGHCNNLQLIHEMEDHVETNHPRKKNPLVNDAKVRNSPVKEKQKDTNGNKIHNNDNKVQPLNSSIFNNANKNITKNTDNDISVKIDTNDKKLINTRSDSVTQPIMNTINDKNNARNDKTITNPISMNTNIDRQRSNITNPFQMNAINDKKPIMNTRNDTKPIINTRNDSVITQPITNTRNEQNGAVNNGIHRMPGLFDDIVIYPFGFKITVPSLSYNIICKRTGDFYCGLCDLVCQENVIIQHVYEVRHLELLQRTPFIEPFSYHLIRAIRDRLHCAICNIPVIANEIYIHIEQLQHKDALNKALQAPKLPPIGVKIPNVPEAPPKTPNIAPNLTPNVTNNNKAQIHNNRNVINNNIKDEIQNNDQVLKPDLEIEESKSEYDDEEEEDNLEEELDRTFDSLASEDATLDEEEHVYLKLKNTYIKISNTSYNTLVHIGDGSRYCFVCSTQVLYIELQRHVDGRPHMENMEKYRFLDKYEDHLLRQLYLMYHCAICNVIITRKELKSHLEWPTHTLQIVTLKNLKKARKTEIKGGVKQIVVSTQKENIYLHENEPKIKICLNGEITNNCTAVKGEILAEKQASDSGFSRKNKIIIFNDNVLKVSWDSWHGISKTKAGYKCNLCQRELKGADIDVHCTGEWHRYGLDKPFEKQYAPALIRKINESTLNCLFCNTEVSNKENLVQIHVNGKKHTKNYEEILKDSSQANTYTDCHDDVLML